MTSSAAELGWAHGTQGTHKSGERCRKTAVPRSHSCAHHSLQLTKGEEGKWKGSLQDLYSVSEL